MKTTVRRWFAFAMAAALAAGTTLGGSAPPQLHHWNVLLIMNDQHRADVLGCYGNSIVQTPWTDRLAAEGIRFLQHFVQTPQCVPSRASLHTGRYPHVHRTPSNRFRLPASEHTLARILKEAGYKTAIAGKLPFAPTDELGGFEQVVASDRAFEKFLRENGWGGEQLAQKRAALVARQHQQSLKGFQAAPVPWDEDLDETAFFAQRAVEFLQKNRGRPFFLHVNFRRPHHPFDPPSPFDRMYQDADFARSHGTAGELEGKPPNQLQALRNTAGFDLSAITAEELHLIKSYYYGMVSLNDKYLGLILNELKRLGLVENTIVVFTSDHGEMLGDHGLLFKGGYFYDEVLRVPLIIRAPGKLPSGVAVNTLTEEVDVLPTILELMEIPLPPGVQGKSLVSLSTNPERLHKEAVFAEFPTMKMVRIPEWKLVRYVGKPYGELYDLRNDPHELENLYDDPVHSATRSRMLELLLDWMVASQDPQRAPVAAGASR